MRFESHKYVIMHLQPRTGGGRGELTALPGPFARFGERSGKKGRERRKEWISERERGRE